VALFLLLILVAWGHGLGIGRYEWPPFSLIRSAYKSVRASGTPPTVPAVSLSIYDMRASLLAAFPPKGQIAMVGDSLTEWAPWSGLFPEQQIANYGIGGDTVDGVLARVPNILAWHPKKFFVMLAINDLAKGQSASSIFPKYRNLVEALGREAARVYVQSTLCTSDGEINMRVTELNAKLRAFCTAEPARCEFIDVIDAFCPHDQSLEDSGLTVDGLHLIVR